MDKLREVSLKIANLKIHWYISLIFGERGYVTLK